MKPLPQKNTTRKRSFAVGNAVISAFLKTAPGTTAPMRWGNAEGTPGMAAWVSGPCFGTIAMGLKQPKIKP